MSRKFASRTTLRPIFLGVALLFSAGIGLATPVWTRSAHCVHCAAAEWTDQASNGVTPPARLREAAVSTDGDTGVGEDQPDLVQPDGATTDPARPDVDPNAPSPPILYDLNALPAPVRKMHDALLAAAKSGEAEKLRPLLETGNGATRLTLDATNEDPIKVLEGQSGDEGGQEILAIMAQILDTGYVHVNAGKPTELYVWPYFFALPIDRLTAPQRVDLFRIVTAGDYEQMKAAGAYIFYRLGITPQGKWAFFLTGS